MCSSGCLTKATFGKGSSCFSHIECEKRSQLDQCVCVCVLRVHGHTGLFWHVAEIKLWAAGAVSPELQCKQVNSSVGGCSHATLFHQSVCEECVSEAPFLSQACCRLAPALSYPHKRSPNPAPLSSHYSPFNKTAEAHSSLWLLHWVPCTMA